MNERQPDRSFLVAYSYGQGGVWAEVKAPTAEDIVATYPCLDVPDEPPSWMNDSLRARLPSDDLSEPGAFLRSLPCQPEPGLTLPKP